MNKLKSLLTVVMAAIMVSGASAQTVVNKYGKPDNFSDVVLIYAGNTGRNSWNKNQFTPYVTHTYTDKTEKWLFDAFLMLEFMRTRTVDGKSVTFGFGNGMGGDKPATQEDWKWILDEYFTSSSDLNLTKLAALDALIADKIKKLGKPNFRHKVIIVCPAPKKDGSVWSSEVWGTVNGKQITLQTEANRLAAVKWYIDELVSRWNKAGYQNIDLEGIYWIEEGMISNAGIIASVNDYARSKGLRTYWIPYYHSGNESYCQKWKSNYKFDMCYYQPGYAFYRDANKTLFPKSQLNTVAAAAKKYGAGVEIEFETSGLSNAMHTYDPASHQRINDYMDVYEAEGVFRDGAVAYYVGSRGLNDMKSTGDAVDHATMDRMADIVNARRIAKFGDMTSLQELNVNTEWAYAGDGRILTTTYAVCYDAMGRKVHEGVGLFECKPGLYIVNDDRGNSMKLLVR